MSHLTDEQLALCEAVHDVTYDAFGSCCIDDYTAPVCETIALGLWERGVRAEAQRADTLALQAIKAEAAAVRDLEAELVAVRSQADRVLALCDELTKEAAELVSAARLDKSHAVNHDCGQAEAKDDAATRLRAALGESE